MADKNNFAKFPPMGWNSYDYYNTMVTEDDVRANARFMADNLKKFGWEYVVVDIQWSEKNAGAKNSEGVQYIPFSEFCVDEFSRQIPAPNRFPSSAGGKGFAPLADFIHSLGLKFGVHIMRGVPRFAAHNHLPIKTSDGSKITADQIANPYSISRWNPDMYGVDMGKKGAQDYYDSLFALYAEWGVDFVKVDDICNTNMYPENPYSAKKEIEAIAQAIQKCGRPIVLSLSPGPAQIDKASHLEKFANMWRVTDDFWDEWRLLKNMFERCEIWQRHTGEGSWPDCDMIPLGALGKGWGSERVSNFSEDEARTMISLWCVFRSPLMIGTNLMALDKKNLALITNEEILAMNKNPNQARSLSDAKDDDVIVWTAKKTESENYFVFFNVSEKAQRVDAKKFLDDAKIFRDLWKKADTDETEFSLRPHECRALLARKAL